MNKKLIRNIILSVLCLGILAGAYLWVLKMPDKNPDEEKASDSDIQTIPVFQTDYKTISELQFKNESGSYTIQRTSADQYTITQFSQLNFSNTKLSGAVMEFAGMSAVKEVTADFENPDNFPIRAEVTVVTDDGAKNTFLLGDAIVGDSGYFMKANDKIYTISKYKADSFFKDINAYRDTALATIDSQSFSGLSILENGKEKITVRPVAEGETDKFSQMTAFVMTSPYYAGVNGDGLTALFKDFPADISVASFADNNIANASKYGIGKLTVTISDANGTYKIAYGNKDDDGNVYAVYNDGNYIFTQKPALYDLMAALEARSLLDKFAHIINIDKISDVTIEGNGEKYTLGIQGEGDTASYSINGVSSKEDYFKKAYQEIIGILITEIKEKDVSGAPEYTVTFTYKDGSKDVSEYIPYDDRNYLLKRNGQSQYIILKKNLSNAMKNIKQYVGSN